MNTTLPTLSSSFSLKKKNLKFGLVAYACSPGTPKWKEAEGPDEKFGVILGYITSFKLA